MKDAKNEENTGKDALNKAAQFLIGRNLPIKNFAYLIVIQTVPKLFATMFILGLSQLTLIQSA